VRFDFPFAFAALFATPRQAQPRDEVLSLGQRVMSVPTSLINCSTEYALKPGICVASRPPQSRASNS